MQIADALIIEIKTEMRKQNCSQRELAKRANLTHSNVSRKINAERKLTVDELRQIAKALKISPVELLRRAEAALADPLNLKGRTNE